MCCLLMYAYTFFVDNTLNSFLLESLFKVQKSKRRSSLASQSRIHMLKKRQSFKMLSCWRCRSKEHRSKIVKGLRRIDRSLEVENFIKLQFQLQALIKVVFSQTEQFLLRNQKQIVLDSCTGSSSSECDFDIEQVMQSKIKTKYLEPLLVGALKSDKKDEMKPDQ